MTYKPDTCMMDFIDYLIYYTYWINCMPVELAANKQHSASWIAAFRLVFKGH